MVTVPELYGELRLGSETDDIPTGVTNILTRLILVATARINKFADAAPDEIKHRAVVLYAGYLYEANPLGPASAMAFRKSGAYDVLWPWRNHNLGIIQEEDNN